MQRGIGHMLDANWISDCALDISESALTFEDKHGKHFRLSTRYHYEREDLAEIAVTGGFVEEHVYGVS